MQINVINMLWYTTAEDSAIFNYLFYALTFFTLSVPILKQLF